MNRRELKNRINDSFLELAPDVYDGIIEAPIPESVLEDELGFGQRMRDSFWKKSGLKMVPIYACLLLVCLCWFGLEWRDKDNVYVTLDINPSVGIELDGSYDIKSVEGLNEDGKRLVKRLQWEKNQTLEDVMERITELLCQDHVFTSRNMILVSIGQSDNEKYKSLKQSIEDGLDASMRRNGVADVVLAFQQTQSGEKNHGRDVLIKRLMNECGLSQDVCERMSVEEMVVYFNQRGTTQLETTKISVETSVTEDTDETTQERKGEICPKDTRDDSDKGMVSEDDADETTTEMTTRENTGLTKEESDKKNSGNNGKKGKSTKVNENSTKEKKKKTPNENSTKEKTTKAPNENSTKEKTTGTPNENSTKEKATGNAKGAEKTTKSNDEK
ncbi:MAG: hypothetical protein J6C01_08205 [Lachnospiraceae bacterium]|nr:hypothetical protein [Lachnospiraceae bacterium]